MALTPEAPAVRPHRWTRAQYDRVIEVGGFGPEDRIELLDGELWAMTPQGEPHAAAWSLILQVLYRTFGDDHVIRGQCPIALDEISEPEPDFAVVPGEPRDYSSRHPEEALLLVEISQSSLSYDRGRKLTAYARNGMPEYWIVDLTANTLEVYRKPAGDQYRSKRVLHASESVTPLHAPDAIISIADLLP